MKSKFSILAITLAGLSQAPEVHSQQPFAAGYSPYGQVAVPTPSGGVPAGAMQQPVPVPEASKVPPATAGVHLIPSVKAAPGDSKPAGRGFSGMVTSPGAEMPPRSSQAAGQKIGAGVSAGQMPATTGSGTTMYVHQDSPAAVAAPGASFPAALPAAPAAPAAIAPGFIGSASDCDAPGDGCDTLVASDCDSPGPMGGGALGGQIGNGRLLQKVGNHFQGGLDLGGQPVACDDCGLVGGDCGCGEGPIRSLLARLHHGHAGAGLFGPTPRPARIWGGVEYLYWWNKDRSVPVMATTSDPGTPFSQAGVLGLSSTSVLFGGGDYDDDPESGVRGTLGLWLNPEQTLGVYGRMFQVGPEDIGFNGSSTGDPILARPFYDVDLNRENSLVAAYPGLTEGGVNIRTSNEIRGYELMLRKLLFYGYANRLDVVGGYHATSIDDRVHAQHELTSLDPGGRVPVGTEINTRDWFDAENNFHGGTIGLMAQGYDGKLTWNLLTKASFGNNNQVVSIRGDSTTSIPGAGETTFNQGLLGLDTNNGVYENDEFTIVPELDLSLSYNLFNNLSVSVGYSIIYWTDVVLAGGAVDTVINPTQIDGPLIGTPAPTYEIHDQSFWVQGLTFGLNGRF